MNTPEMTHSARIERRGGDDRRFFWTKTLFPLVDRTGFIVIKDRRYRPDRRIANLQVTSHFYNYHRRKYR